MESEFIVKSLDKQDQIKDFIEGYGYVTPYTYAHKKPHLVGKKTKKIFDGS